jgi:hypothetical protein
MGIHLLADRFPLVQPIMLTTPVMRTAVVGADGGLRTSF